MEEFGLLFYPESLSCKSTLSYIFTNRFRNFIKIAINFATPLNIKLYDRTF